MSRVVLDLRPGAMTVTLAYSLRIPVHMYDSAIADCDGVHKSLEIVRNKFRARCIVYFSFSKWTADSYEIFLGHT